MHWLVLNAGEAIEIAALILTNPRAKSDKSAAFRTGFRGKTAYFAQTSFIAPR